MTKTRYNLLCFGAALLLSLSMAAVAIGGISLLLGMMNMGGWIAAVLVLPTTLYSNYLLCYQGLLARWKPV